MGIERIIYFLGLEDIKIAEEKVPDIYVGILGDIKAEAYKIVAQLRDEGFCAETDYFGRSVKAQMKYANKCGAKYCVIIGPDELKGGLVKVKNMADGTQTECEISGIGKEIG